MGDADDVLKRADAWRKEYGDESDGAGTQSLVRDLAEALRAEREVASYWFRAVDGQRDAYAEHYKNVTERAERAEAGVQRESKRKWELEQKLSDAEAALAEARQEAGFWKRGKGIADEALAEAQGLLGQWVGGEHPWGESMAFLKGDPDRTRPAVKGIDKLAANSPTPAPRCYGCVPIYPNGVPEHALDCPARRGAP